MSGIRSGGYAVARIVALAAIVALPAAAHAQVVRDTLDDGISTWSLPMIAADPVDGTLHVGYHGGGVFHHAWRTGGVWQNEVAVPTFTYTGDLFGAGWAAAADGRVALAYDAGGGALVFARRGGGVWSSETLAVHPGWSYRTSLALDPSSGDPTLAVVAFDAGETGVTLAHLELARRPAGGWDFAELDTTRFDIGGPSLAIDNQSRPRMTIGRGIGSNGGPGGLYYLETTDIHGPYTWTLLDTAAAGAPNDQIPGRNSSASALVLDRWSDEPRVAYGVFVNGVWALRYAARNGGSWDRVDLIDPIETSNSSISTPIAMGPTPAGDPRVVWTALHSFLAKAAPADIESPCVDQVAGFDVMLYQRAGATGAGAFAGTRVARHSRSSVKAVIGGIADGAELVWRDPSVNNGSCRTQMIHGTVLPTTSVTPGGSTSARFAIAPNPLVSGATLTVRLGLARAQTVELSLLDIAGRRVASTEVRLGTGASDTRWTPQGLHPGVYRLIARTAHTRLGTATVVVLR